jgi:exodeoxyribonuclease VIII
MVDLETLGKNSYASILSIGAVKFDPFLTPSIIPEDDPPYETFHVYVDPASCAMHGLSMDTSTVMWWLAQSKESQQYQVEAKRMSLPEALEEFAKWFGKDSMPTWGNGATFDNVILSNAYTACGMERPWAYFDDRCYRTMKSFAPDIKIERLGTHHNALHDAMSQARHLQHVMQKLLVKEAADAPGEEIVKNMDTPCGVND